MASDPATYASIADATRDIRDKVNDSTMVTHPLNPSTFGAVVPDWTDALSGFAAGATVSSREAAILEQVHNLYEQCQSWLSETAQNLDVGTLNEHDPARVLFMGLFRDLQVRFALKQNLNPHKLAVLLDGRYTVVE